MEYLNDQVKQVKYLWKRKRYLITQALNLSMIVCTALMTWKSLIVLSNSESPIVVVLSGSMEPGFQRGDILWLDNYQDTPIEVGEIIVFQVNEKEIPIVHRVLEKHEVIFNSTEEAKYLTKGDNNQVNDRGLYSPGQRWLSRSDIMGRIQGVVRYMGMMTIILNDYPPVKYIMVGLMGYFVLTNKE